MARPTPTFPWADQERLWNALDQADVATTRAIVLAPGFPGAELRTATHPDTGISSLAMALDLYLTRVAPAYPLAILDTLIEAGALPDPGTPAAETFLVDHLRGAGICAANGRVMLRRCQAHGLPVNGQDAEGDTLLSLAVQDLYEEWTAVLLEEGADPRIGRPAWTLDSPPGDPFGPTLQRLGQQCKARAVALDRETRLAAQPPIPPQRPRRRS